MKSIIFSLCIFSSFIACENQEQKGHIFFLHNRFLEYSALTAEHYEHGRVEYKEILAAFEKAGFVVYSEKRNSETQTQTYARKIVGQIDSLLSLGVAPQKITVIGTSKGGYIAQYTSTYLQNPKVNFVFIGAYRDSDIDDYPNIEFCGNILNIYDSSDPYGNPAFKRKTISTCDIKHFRDLKLNTGLHHGFLFKAMNEWIAPSINWASGQYD